MDKKKFKRESRQTGMTDERKKALEAIRELKNSSMSRLDQAIQNGEINSKDIILEDDNHEDNSNDGFVVDEFGNSVRYENEYEDDNVERVNIKGKIIKYLGNMKQGSKNPQSSKVDKNLVQAKKQAIVNLMDQIGEDDEDIDDKNNNRFNSNNKFLIKLLKN